MTGIQCTGLNIVSSGKKSLRLRTKSEDGWSSLNAKLIVHPCNIGWTSMERYPAPKYSIRLHPGRKYVPFEYGVRESWGAGYPPVKASKMSEVKKQNPKQ